MLKQGRLNVVIDGQFGSTGKGVISGYIAKKQPLPIEVAVTNAAPNAGHTVDFEDGRGQMVTNHLPTSALWDDNTKIYLCAGSIIEPKLLHEELVKFDINPKRVCIHPNAAIIEDEDIQAEKDKYSSVTKIASTQKGVGHALARKVLRQHNVAGLRPKLFHPDITIAKWNINKTLRENEKSVVLMEVPQGFSLGINSGHEFPFTTCREISVAQALSDAGVDPQLLGNVTMSLRTYPIRVGNIVDDTGKELGNSGPFYPDSTELSWEDLGVTPERTTVTKRIRRIATFSTTQYAEACDVLNPKFVFMNFCNYMNRDQLLSLIDACSEFRHITHFGVGPSVEDVITRNPTETDLELVERLMLEIKRRGR